jgi:transcriptional regulator with GAF, ATPase, and Fis domain
MAASESRDTSDRRWRGFVNASARLAGDAEPADVFSAILDAVITLLDLEAASIGLTDPTASRVRFVLSRGPAKLDEFEVETGVGIAGWVAKHGQGVLVNDVSRDARFFKGIDQRTGFQTRAILCAPLRFGNRVLGIIEAINPKRADGFTESDLELLTAFGDVAASALERARTVSALRGSNAELRAAATERYKLILGPSGTMQGVLDLARTAAESSSTVLLLGESGTGKEVVARAIHQWSARATGPFVAVNCTALSAELLESELFGHERGSFTGAIAQRKGRFEIADGGTLFLDEIGDLAPTLQAKLLRALQDREFQRVGGEKTIRVDVRIVAATNRDLREAVRSRTFREDLYYRLNVITIELPPLRERVEDVPGLVEHFVQHFCNEMKRPHLTVSKDALDCLCAYPWPGNVRELQNAIERAIVLSKGPEIRVAELPRDIRDPLPMPAAANGGGDGVPDDLELREAIDAFTRLRIERCLAAAGGSQTEAARRLGLPQSNLSRLMKRLGLR